MENLTFFTLLENFIKKKKNIMNFFPFDLFLLSFCYKTIFIFTDVKTKITQICRFLEYEINFSDRVTVNHLPLSFSGIMTRPRSQSNFSVYGNTIYYLTVTRSRDCPRKRPHFPFDNEKTGLKDRKNTVREVGGLKRPRFTVTRSLKLISYSRNLHFR